MARWVEAFWSKRHRHDPGQRTDVGKPGAYTKQDGSPLSPILFLFFNAGLVQRKITWNGGSIAFVDDFTAWAASLTAKDNLETIESIISTALDWEGRSVATFEAEKTAIIHFSKSAYKNDPEPFIVKGKRCILSHT